MTTETAIWANVNNGGPGDILYGDVAAGATTATVKAVLLQNNTAYQSSQPPAEIVFDTADNLFFTVKQFFHNATSGPVEYQILEGQITSALGGNGSLTVLYDSYTDSSHSYSDANGDNYNAGTGLQYGQNGFFNSLTIDPVNHTLYWGSSGNEGTTGNVPFLDKLVYSPTYGGSATHTVIGRPNPVGTSNGGYEGFVPAVAVDTVNNVEYAIVEDSYPTNDGNYIVKVNLSTGAVISKVDFGSMDATTAAQEHTTTGEGGDNSVQTSFLNPVYGTLFGIALDSSNQKLYFSTYSAMQQGVYGGIYVKDLNSGAITTIYKEQSTGSSDSSNGLFSQLSLDLANNRYYVEKPFTVTNSNGSVNGAVFSGHLTDVNIAPTQVLSTTSGGYNTKLLNFAIDDAPVLASGGSHTATESPGTNSTASAIAGSVTLTDNEGTVQSATVSITGNFLTGTGHQDSLSFTSQNGITGSYNSASGVLTLSGAATAANYQTALNSVTFTDTGDNPDNYGTATTRTISYSVYDGLLTSNTATTTVNVAATNDAPAVTGTRGTIATSFNEDNSLTISKATFLAGITDPDSQSLAITNLTYTNGSVSDTSPGSNSGSLVFTPAQDYNGAFTVSYGVSDGSAVLGGLSFSTTVNAVNDAPVETAPSATQNATDNAASPLVFSSANGNALSVSDVDVGTGNLEVTLGVGHGTLSLAQTTGLTFSTGDGTTDATMKFQGTQANVNAALNGLKYYDAQGYSGSDTLTFSTNDLGNTGSGGAMSASKTVAISDTHANVAPSVSTGGATLAYTENQTATAIAPSTTVSDSDSADFNGGSLTVAFSANGAAEDQLTIGNQGTGAGQIGLSGANVTYGGTTIGTMSGGTNGAALTVAFNAAAATPAAAQALARDVLYSDASDNPSTTARTVTFSLNDGDGGSSTGTGTATVNVTAVNDAPVNSVPATQTILEDGSLALSGAAAINVSDVDVGSGNLTVYMQAAHGTFSSAAFGGNVGTNFSFQGTPAYLNNVLHTLTYVTDPNFSGTGSVTVMTKDQGNTGTGGEKTTSTSFNIIVTSVNDAPSGADKTVTTAENTAHAITVADLGFTDPNDSPANSLLAVKIGTITGAGALTDNGTAVTAGQTVSASDITGGHLVFTPAANGAGAAYGAFTFQVQDDGGTANGGVDTDPTAHTLTFNVSPNQAPAGADKTVTTSEDTGYTFTTSDFGFSDANGGTLSSVVVTTLPTAGTLTDNGVAVTAGQHISAADLASNYLVYQPAANASGTGYAHFTFQVQDNQGTTGGGQDTDQSANTLTFNVTPVNDAPSGADKTITTNEDIAYTLAASDFGFTDYDDFGSGSLAAVKITTLPGAGTLTDNGMAVAAGQFVSAYDIYTDRLVFTPAANASGAGYAHFTFQVQDDGGTANGGVDLDQSPNTLTFNVLSVNDAPVADPVARQTIATNEDTPYVFSAADFAFSDANDNPQNALKAVIFSEINLAGTLTDNGVAVADGSPVSAADINAGHVVFTPTANANSSGSGLGSFQFQVQDDGGTANGGVDTSAAISKYVNIQAVDDAPSGADKTITTNEDTAYTLGTSDFGFSDPNDSPADGLQAVKITTLPTAGTLTDNGVAVTAGQFVSVDDISGGKLVFTPSADANGTGYSHFTFQVQDGGDTTQGGVNLDQSPNTLTFNVTATNDAPVLSPPPSAVTYTEDGGAVAVLQGVSVSDPDLPASFVGGSIEVAVSGGDGRLAFRPGADFTVDANGDGTYAVDYTGGGGSVAVGTLVGTSRADLTITGLTAAATPAVVTDLVDSIVFSTNASPVVGDRTVTLTVDDGGNTGSGGSASASVSQVVHVVDRAPDAPAGLTLADDTGADMHDGLTKDARPVVSGSGAHAGDTITLYADGGADGTATVRSDGTWTVASTAALADGGHGFTATATTGAGAVSAASQSLAVTIDATAPATPSDLAFTGDGQPISSPGATRANTIVESGTAEAGALVTVTAGGVTLATTTADGAGAWSASFATAPLSGQIRLYTTATDAAGNVSAIASSGFNITHLFGTSGNDTLTAHDNQGWLLSGGGGDDVLTGADGADLLTGGTGADTMQGGLGDDRYYVDNAGDTVSEAANAGTDTVITSVDFDAGQNAIEYIAVRGTAGLHLTAGSVGAHLLGGVGDDVLTGGAGNDILTGGAGADTMRGGLGDDTYYVDNAGDTVTEAAGAGNDTVYTTVDYDATGQSIETITAQTAAGVHLTAGTSAARLYGGAGNDVLTGGLLGDALVGGAGDDRLVATVGHDILTGGAGADTFVLSPAVTGADSPKIQDFVSGTDLIELSAQFQGSLPDHSLDPDAFRSNTTGKAETTGDRIIYNSSNGLLTYDDDGTGPDHAVQIAALAAHPHLTAHDFTFG